MPPRKTAQEPYAGPPGPIQMEVRINGKIVFLQRVHAYSIDQQHDRVVVQGALRPEKPVAEPSLPIEVAPPKQDDAA